MNLTSHREKQNIWPGSKYIVLLVILLVAALLKLWLIWQNAVPFNSDEAIVALMARHILEGELPIFFYGQAYMGSLDAFFVAAGFWLLGDAVWVIRFVQLLLYLGVLITTYRLGEVAFGSTRVGLLAAGLLAIPTVNTTLYTTVSLGGYGEALLIGNLILLSGLRAVRILTSASLERNQTPAQSARWWFWCGAYSFWTGLGVWALGLTLVYSVPMGIYLVVMIFRTVNKSRFRALGGAGLVGGIGSILGAFPWWVYAFQHGLHSLVSELFGSAVAVEQVSYLSRAVQHLISLVLLGGTVTLGFRPPWAVEWLALPVLPLTLILWMWVFWTSARQKWWTGPERHGKIVMGGVMLVVAVGFVFTSFGVDPSGRYFLPFSTPLALMVAQAILAAPIRYPMLRWCFPMVLIAYSLAGTVQCAMRVPPGITTQFNAETQVDHRYDQELIGFLQKEGETRGYTHYWVSYPLAFLSSEQLIFVPQLPYHANMSYTPRDDRYSLYDDSVASSRRVAYITTSQPELDRLLRVNFQNLGAEWEEKTIGDYQVFYHLSKPIRAEQLDLQVAVP